MYTELEQVHGYLNDASQLLSTGALEQAFAHLVKASSLLDSCIENDCQSTPSTINSTDDHRVATLQAALAMAG